MPSRDDVQYAMETTRVLLTPDRRIDTFGDTSFEFLVLSEPMDSVGTVCVRTGSLEAVRPRLVRPDRFDSIEMEGFDERARERFDRLVSKMREAGHSLAFLQYGFRFSRGKVVEERVHTSLDEVRAQVLEDARKRGNPALAIIEGVDDVWEVSLFKFVLEMIEHSMPINGFDFQRRGLL
ncbi:hypothetical protein HNR46_003969 [Haloferula luteola]|uniref:Uncharacterized protein n=1 Tax=Haloferula luteola TaxID=595692 RepID=A0A840VGI7_9BACT|nr:hypothetical protein [Haloferula luteola]MBB5353708.1 hypothetical protein [Haloferula luteola]